MANLQFNSRRSTVYGQHGMVATSQPLASQIGLSILRNNGTAMDAAIAISAALAVTEPCSTGIGGDCFLLYYDAATKEVSSLNGSGRAPRSLSLKTMQEIYPNEAKIPITKAHAITVPGAVAGWIDAMEKWGTLSLEQVLRPAAILAREGFPVSQITAHHWNDGVWQLELGEHGKELLIDGKAPEEGQVFKNEYMANCLEEIIQNGKDGFYSGRIAQAIVDVIQQHGGQMSLEDFKSHKSTFDVPIKTCFHGVDVYEVPPNGQGITALIALNILNQVFEDNIPEHNSAEYLHYLIEALRLAFADSRHYVSDMAFDDLPIKALLSEKYAIERASQVRLNQTIVDIVKGSPEHCSDTVSFQVVDKAGNAVSMVNSNYTGFGTGLVPANCGFSLQSRGSNFSLDEHHLNAYAPGKRPYHTIIPGMALQNDELHSTFTVMGGFMQPQGHVQILLNMLLFNMTPQAALDSARFCIGSGHAGCVGEISIEEGIDDATKSDLESKGHAISRVESYNRSLFGRGQIIVRNPTTGVLAGGSDGRSDGCAMGW